MTTHLIFLLSFSLFFIQIHASNLCVNGRGCQENQNCSPDGEYCCRDGKCDKRSLWSLVGSKCKNGHKCLSTEICTKNNECISREITICDSYFHIEHVSKCTNEDALIKHGFEQCSHFYHHYDSKSVEHNGVMKCAENCLLSKIATKANKSDKCSEMQKEAIASFPICYVNCGMCLVSSTWKNVFERAKNWGIAGPKFELEFASLCSQQYWNKRGNWTAETIKEKAQKFVVNVDKVSGVNVTEFFNDLMHIQDNSTIDIQQHLNLTKILCLNCTKFQSFVFHLKNHLIISIILSILIILIFLILFVSLFFLIKKFCLRPVEPPSYMSEDTGLIIEPPRIPAPKPPVSNRASDSGYEYSESLDDHPYERPTVEVQRR